MIFWSIIIAMVLGGLVAVLPALSRKTKPQSAEGVAEDLYRQRVEELQADIAAGVIPADEEQAARQEIERTLLAEAGQRPLGKGTRPVERAIGAGLAAVLVPSIALSVYLSVGLPKLGVEPPTPAATLNAQGHASFEPLVKSLEDRLAREPDDVDGWTILARTYKSLKQYAKAVTAIEHVHKIVGDEPAVMLQYADILAMANGGAMKGKSADLAKRALEMQPDNITALWLTGFAEREEGNIETAIKHWRRAQAVAGDDSKAMSELQSLIDQAMMEQAAVPDANKATAMATPKERDPGAPSSIRVSIHLADHLKSRMSPDDTVFVFARSLNGPPMPLAVVRRKANELPFDVTLDDSMAMTPQNSLSSVAEVRLVARVSKSGTPLAQPGDLQGEVVPVEVGTGETIAIWISSVVQ